MASNIDEITINYEEDDVLKVKETDKEVLTRGAWTTILFKYQNWEHAKQEYGQERFTIRRYKKVNGNYLPQSKFNISNAKQAQQIISALQKWMPEETE